MSLLVLHVEIPVTDLDRAMAFYTRVFDARFASTQVIHGNRMAFFEVDEGAVGASAALCEGEVYRPTRDGAVIYLAVDKLDAVLTKAVTAGAKILFGPEPAVPGVTVAEISDSEGNRIALQSGSPTG